MNTKEMTGEQISAFADGECANSEVELALAALRRSGESKTWEIYHQIGDVLRSDDMAVTLSPGFAERMAARLEAEPTIVAPAAAKEPATAGNHHGAEAATAAAHPVRRWAVPGAIAAAAAAAVAFVATPQLMVAMKSDPMPATPTTIAAAVQAVPVNAASNPPADAEHVVAASVPDGVVLRDARIDDYLLAHQRFSPSVFSTAQYARSATFETDSNK